MFLNTWFNLVIHSFNHSHLPLLSHSLMQSLTFALNYSFFTHSLMQALTRALNYSFTHAITHTCPYLFIHTVENFATFAHSSIDSITQPSLINSTRHSLRLSIKQSLIHSSSHLPFDYSLIHSVAYSSSRGSSHSVNSWYLQFFHTFTP
jgi:hypothetical protein